MIFLEETDFDTVIDSDRLLEVTEGNDTILDTLELMAMGEMTGYLNVRFDPTKCFDTAPARIPIIVQTMVDIVLYHAHARIMPDNIPTLRVDRYKNAITWCEKVADGFINPVLPIKEDDPTSPLRFGNSADKQNQYY
jgi:phage gp36-like protein